MTGVSNGDQVSGEAEAMKTLEREASSSKGKSTSRAPSASYDLEANGAQKPEHDDKPEHQPEKQKPGWRRMISHIGPGFLVCMAFIDPGSVETLFQTASQNQYQLLWIILLGFILVFIVQSLAANLGVVTGMHLAEHYRLEYPKYLNYCFWILAQAAVVGADISEVIGTAFALDILLHIPVWVGILLTGFTPFILVGLQKYGFRKVEMALAMVVFVIAACFVGELPYVKPKSSDVFKGFIPGFKSRDAVANGIAFLGALIMPHNLFIHSALVLTRRPPQSVKGINDACRYFAIESAPPMALALFVNIVAVVVAGSICFASNISPGTAAACKDLTLYNAAILLKDVLGKWSRLVYGISILASSQGSALTVGCSGQYVMQGFLQKKIKKWIITVVTRGVAILPSLIAALVGGPSACARLIIISSMVLSFELPFTILPLLRFTSSRKKMGPHKNHIAVIIAAWVLGLSAVGINVYYLSVGFVEWLIHNKLPKAASVIIGIIVFPIMIVYLVTAVYVVFKKVDVATYKPPPPLPLPTNKDSMGETIEEEEEIPYREDLVEMAESE
ncbi:Metal transporter [Nymphaea thermarum]|nr:Metal transporter [Nymphaea thermarum]